MELINTPKMSNTTLALDPTILTLLSGDVNLSLFDARKILWYLRGQILTQPKVADMEILEERDQAWHSLYKADRYLLCQQVRRFDCIRKEYS